MAWHFKSGLSLATQIEDRLRRDIISGVYELGGQFPTVRQLAEDASVNPNTMQRALTQLENEGLIISLGTAGRIVTADSEVLEKSKNTEISSFIGDVIKSTKALNIEKDQFIELIKKGWDENE